MKRALHILLIVILAIMALVAVGTMDIKGAEPQQITEGQVDAALKRLDRELTRREMYKQRRKQRIDSLKSARMELQPADTLWPALTMKIGDAYNTFNIDSALVYYSQGYEQSVKAGDRQLAAAFKANRATYLALAGYVSDAINEFESIDSLSLTPEMRHIYYLSGRQMFSFISGYYDSFISTYDYWNRRAIEMERHLLQTLDPASDTYHFYEGEFYYNNHEPGRARTVLLNLLDSFNEDQHGYAIVCNLLARIAKERGDINEYKYYLALSAISDVRTATLEVVSLQELGSYLSQEHQTERAHSYLSAALSNAVESHASIRMLQTSELLTLVEEDHLRQVVSWRRQMNILVSILLVLVVALIIAMVSLRKQIISLSAMKENLQTANRTKEVYISQFLSLCTIYMDKLRDFAKTVSRKLNAGQADDLLRMVKSSKFVEDQSREFFVAFDDAFLHIYPNFVEDVNKLLRPGEQIELRSGEILNTDLRILAFMRLGIEDTNQVARVLNYSVNTIYVYRNKMRNRAISRDTFEQDVMAIGSI